MKRTMMLIVIATLAAFGQKIETQNPVAYQAGSRDQHSQNFLIA